MYSFRVLYITKTRKTGGGLYPDGPIIGFIFLSPRRRAYMYYRGGGGGISGWDYNCISGSLRFNKVNIVGYKVTMFILKPTLRYSIYDTDKIKHLL